MLCCDSKMYFEVFHFESQVILLIYRFCHTCGRARETESVTKIVRSSESFEPTTDVTAREKYFIGNVQTHVCNKSTNLKFEFFEIDGKDEHLCNWIVERFIFWHFISLFNLLNAFWISDLVENWSYTKKVKSFCVLLSHKLAIRFKMVKTFQSLSYMHHKYVDYLIISITTYSCRKKDFFNPKKLILTLLFSTLHLVIYLKRNFFPLS